MYQSEGPFSKLRQSRLFSVCGIYEYLRMYQQIVMVHTQHTQAL